MLGFTLFFNWFWDSLFRRKKMYQGYDLTELLDTDSDDGPFTYEELLEQYKSFVLDEFSDEDVDVNEPNGVPPLLPGNEGNEGENKCCLRSGIITNIYSDSGLIDDIFHFDLRDAPADIRVNDMVTYLAFRPREYEDWQVRKVYAVEERSWDGENTMTEGQDMRADVPKGTCYRSELRQVTERRGREVIVNDGEFRFDLSSVSALFIPVVGDFIYLDALVEEDENQVNLAGEILNIEKIRWVRFKQCTGTVTKWFDNGEGQINSNVFFKKDACTAGYTPVVGDKVNTDIIESYQGTCTWRALNVASVENFKKQVRNLCRASASEAAALCQSKCGISLNSYEFHFETLLKGKTGQQITVNVTNDSNNSHILLYGDFYKARSEPQVSPLYPIKREIMNPGATLSCTFKCFGKNLGTSKELFVFCFKGFKVGCNFIIEVIDDESSLMISSQPSQTYAEKQQKFYKGSGVQPGQHLLSGVKPILPPKFIERRLGAYSIPDRYWTAIFYENNKLKNKLNIEKAFLDLVPSLQHDLSIDSYMKRFHTLLHIEEIEATLNLQEYTMEKVMFRNLPSAKEYLALDVPGLAEKRPSLLVGDAVHAHRPWKEDGLVFEGFVHKTLGKKVWLRFSNDFHLNYSGDVYDVKFIFSRTAIRRQHCAIDLALSHLGPPMLFPTKLDLKPPQVIIEDDLESEGDSQTINVSNLGKHKIRWVNQNLNCYQKDAIKRVLSGEARPLPYVIFGPPGTGKTMTMVELILQIFFLMPDSRLLIATPSNSSANLITERLLDSEMLKPGDLVRLVGYHVLEEGSLPERLRPYSTTGNIKSVTGKEALPSPVGQLEQSSNKSTLGRHRITIGTCIALGQLYNMGFPRGHFTHVLVDEAGQATEPEIMVPLAFLHCKQGQVVLAGDPLQLGPVVSSSLALRYGLGISYLDRLIERFPYKQDLEGFPDTLGYDPRLITRLVKNYRSLPEILNVPNLLFYDLSLQPQVSSTEGPDAEILKRFTDHLPKRDPKYPGPPAILFHGVVGTNLQGADSPSWFNPQETLIAMTYLTTCYSLGLEASDVGIITPYRAQVEKMRWYYNRFDIPLPKIGSVEEFQGQERKVIILSVVRSSTSLVQSDIVYSLGFVASRKRLNVAITRARSLLIIIGNPHVLALDRDWRNVMQYCVDRQAYIGCDSPLDALTLFREEEEEIDHKNDVPTVLDIDTQSNRTV